MQYSPFPVINRIKVRTVTEPLVWIIGVRGVTLHIVSNNKSDKLVLSFRFHTDYQTCR